MLVSQVPQLRDYWYPVAEAAKVTDSPVPVQLLGQRLVLWRTASGDLSIVDPHCPHRSGSLGLGWVNADCIVCPYHGWEFDASGRCVTIPQLEPSTPIPARAAVHSYPAIERYGVVWTSLGAPAGDIPRWNEAEDGWRVFVEFFDVWHVSAFRIIDNNLDLSHPAYVHRTTFGDPEQASMVPTVEPRPDGLVTRLDREVKGVAAQLGLTDDEAVRIVNRAEIELLAPLTSHARFYFSDASDFSFLGTATPVDDDHSIYMRLTALAGTDEEQPYETFHAFGRRVTEEDRVLLEGTNPDFPIDIVSEVHVKTDRATLQYRRYLQQLVGGPAPHDAVVPVE